MDHLDQLLVQMQRHLVVVLVSSNSLVLAWAWFAGAEHWPLAVTFGGGLVLILTLSILIAFFSGKYLISPTKALWQAILHAGKASAEAPQPDKLRLGRELVANLTTQIYQLATMAERSETLAIKRVTDLRANFIASNLPLPLFVLDPSQNIKFANEAAGQYVGMPASELIGKNVYMVLDMAFPTTDTLDRWLKTVAAKSVTAGRTWERVRLNVLDNHPTLLFDLAAYYNKNNPEGIEAMLVLFDHTKMYSQDDQAVSFMALSVHELRTPLTLLRGYIEAFEEELGGQLDPQMKDFMFKMSATAQQLTAFVNNILNVARVDDDQLELRLQEENWGNIIRSAADSMALRARVRGITVEYSIEPNLPTVGVDRVSIHEVINNLVDNAIKYSGTSNRIRISTYLTPDGLVETTVQDWGVGIPASVIPNLFSKFYRDHHNRAQIGGTGLGLYLSKAIMSAHGGNIWVRSQEGKGSIFGFTLLPYSQIAAQRKNDANNEIVRSAHGWIKNHSLYRR